jgi:hypothetical protein
MRTKSTPTKTPHLHRSVGVFRPQLNAVARASKALDEAVRHRDDTVRAAVAAGYSNRTVAAAARMSHPAIAAIVERG